MQRVVGACLIMAACAAMGAGKSHAVSRELFELRVLLQMTILLKGEIGSQGMGLYEAFREISSRLQDPYSAFITLAASKMKEKRAVSLGEIFAECEKETLQESFLGREERQRLLELGSCLGYLDRKMQLRQLELYEKELEYSIEVLREEMPRKKKMYQGLGILGGFMIIVLIW